MAMMTSFTTSGSLSSGWISEDPPCLYGVDDAGEREGNETCPVLACGYGGSTGEERTDEHNAGL